MEIEKRNEINEKQKKMKLTKKSVVKCFVQQKKVYRCRRGSGPN